MALHFRASTMDPDARYCHELTRREAKNFYWGFVALPKEQRVAIYALYGFARQVDDEIDRNPAIGKDGSGANLFAMHRSRLENCFAGTAQDPIMRVLSQVVREYAIPREELEALIRGVEMDVQQNRYATWDDLQLYCRHVAASVGRMCVRIFGFTDPIALDFAEHLGIAMQLANILRDVLEDLELGRIYLPAEDLDRFGVSEDAMLRNDPGPGWEHLVRYEIARAEALFESGLRVRTVIPRRASACILTMAGIYQAIVHEISRDPYLPLTQRASLGSRQKFSVMFRSWLQAV